MAMMYKGRELSLPLSDENREFLLSRGKDTLVARLDRQWENTRPREEKAKAPQVQSTQDNEPEGDEDDVPPYTEWTNEELRAELADRGLSTEGKKADLVARLEEDDSQG